MIVCDTSSVSYLYRVGHFEVFRSLFGSIVVPEAVVSELLRGRAEGYAVPDPAAYDWIEVRASRVPNYLAIVDDLGPGETEVLALALKEPDSVAVLDDLFARRLARAHGIAIVGTAGILLRAKEEGLVQAIGPILEDMVGLGFRLRPALWRKLLLMAGEREPES